MRAPSAVRVVRGTPRWPIAALALLLAGCAGRSAAGPPAERVPRSPNVVVVLMDDVGYGDIGAYNLESRIPTPNLDALAATGMRFTDAHSPSAVCTPTRYGLLTGRYAWRTSLKSGVLYGYDPLLIEPGRTTMASLLRERGYATAAIGKWHLGLGEADSTRYDLPLRPGPNALGFDYFFGIPASLDMAPYLFVHNEGVVEPATDSIAGSEMRRSGGAGFWRAGPVAPGFRHEDVLPITIEKAVDYLRERAADPGGQPFFLYLPLSAPHTPWLAAEPFRGRSGAGPYGDFLAQVDAGIGEVLDQLDRLGMAEKTLVIVTSDNGAHWLQSDIAQWGHRANGALRGQKADIWEGGHRVPLLARWPGRIPAGSTSDALVSLTDLFATTAALVGSPLAAGKGEDSYDLLPVLLGRRGVEPTREAVVMHSLNGVFAVREEPWKLIVGELGSGGFSEPRKRLPGEGEPGGQLYDLDEDPGERRNLYRERPEIVQRLSSLLERYRHQGYSRP